MISLFIFSMSTIAWECEAYDSETSNYIYGECLNGNFEGYDSSTGDYVYGDCAGGNLEAHNSQTGNYVYGDCKRLKE